MLSYKKWEKSIICVYVILMLKALLIYICTFEILLISFYCWHKSSVTKYIDLRYAHTAKWFIFTPIATIQKWCNGQAKSEH